jgi:hypothetical protein
MLLTVRKTVLPCRTSHSRSCGPRHKGLGAIRMCGRGTPQRSTHSRTISTCRVTRARATSTRHGAPLCLSFQGRGFLHLSPTCALSSSLVLS